MTSSLQSCGDHVTRLRHHLSSQQQQLGNVGDVSPAGVGLHGNASLQSLYDATGLAAGAAAGLQAASYPSYNGSTESQHQRPITLRTQQLFSSPQQQVCLRA